jgi:hypothetical protein
MMLFVLVMEATSASPLTPEVTPQWLDDCAGACMVQLNRDVAAEWGGAYSVRRGTAQDVAPGEIVLSIVDSLPNDPNAIAYHDVNGQAVPVAFLGLQTCSTLADASTAISHELCETAVDPECNTWSDDGGGQEFAQEACDAVESFSYDIGGIRVSDFVLRAFFAPSSGGPYHYLGSTGSADLARPYATARGGYQITRASGGTVTQVQGEMRPMRKAHAVHWSSRTFRRRARG